MIVNVGIMKSGTTWMEFMAARLTKSQRVHMHGSHKWPVETLREFLSLNRNEPLSIRDHFRPSSHATFQEFGLPVIFTYRHPADIVTSLHYHLTVKYPDMNNGGDFGKTLDMFEWAAEPIEWKSLPGVFVTRYEDLQRRPFEELVRLGEFLKRPFKFPEIRKTIKKYSFENMFKRKPGDEDKEYWSKKGNKKTHRNGRKGIIGDHVEFLVADRLEMWNERFPNIAKEWGYDDESGKCSDVGSATRVEAGSSSPREERRGFFRKFMRKRAA